MRTTIMTLALLALAAGAAAQAPRISGFVDAAYFHDTAAKNGEFGLDQVEIDITHQAGERTSVRADLEWIKDGEGYAAQVEQAFMTFTPRCGWGFTFGRFNAPLGFEAIDPADMYQYSHSLVYDNGGPSNLTGARVNRDLGGGLDLALHLSNGWDRNTADANLTWGGRLGYVRDGFAGGVSAISGKETLGEPAAPLTRTVLDTDLAYTMGAWLFGAEVNHGSVEQAAGLESDWLGVLIMSHLGLNEWAGVTVRLEQIDDQDGYLFGTVDGAAQVRRSLTLAPTFVLDEGFGALVELRLDLSDQEAFLDGDGAPTDTATAVAFEMTYSF